MAPAINDLPGEWVLVEGFVRGADERADRELVAFLRGVFIARRDVNRFKARFLAIEHPGNQKIPAGATEHYLYAGEAGRRMSYARHLLWGGRRYRRQTADAFGIRIELPYVHFGWESYHSSQNEFSDFYLPSPSLIQRLGLASKNREIDFYDLKGLPATCYREEGGAWKGDRHSLLYVRADLLQRYLSETRQVLVWCNWGERDWLKKMEGNNVIDNSARLRIYQSHSHIHRSFFQWSARDPKVV